MFMRILRAANYQVWKNHSPGIFGVCVAFMLYDFLKGHLTMRVAEVDTAVFAVGYVICVVIYMAASYCAYYWPPKPRS
jgi:hypothetical protein